MQTNFFYQIDQNEETVLKTNEQWRSIALTPPSASLAKTLTPATQIDDAIPIKQAPAQEHREGEFCLRDRRRPAEAAAPDGEAFVADVSDVVIPPPWVIWCW